MCMNCKLTEVKDMESVSVSLKECAACVGAETWEDRKKKQTPSCKFGEEGVCCRICSMGPCRITHKASRGICGADADAIAARNYLRMVAGGTAAHSDHGREICHVLHATSVDGHYQVKDREKLLSLAREWGIEVENRDIYEIAHEVALTGLMEYGKPFGTQRFLSRATPERQELWSRLGIAPRAIDREIATAMHMTHMGNTADAEALVMQGLRTGLADGWGGSMMATEMTDILFGTPAPKDTEADLGVLDRDMVNIIVHGHDPAMSEMIVLASEDKDLLEYARSKGAKGINIAGLCCTANEVTVRHGVKIAGNFLQQENALLTGMVEMMAVDVQCIFPALGPLSECFHTKFITTSPIARIPKSVYVEFNPETAREKGRELVRMAIDNFENRDPNKVFVIENKQPARVGYSCEAIIKELNGVTNSFVDERDTYKPLIDVIKAGVLRGAVAMVGCNNPKVRPDYSHIEIMKTLLKNDIIIITSAFLQIIDIHCGISYSY